MTREQLLQAQPGIVALIREQGEKRLENQNAFADALDSKGGTLLTAAGSLAAASAAVFAGALGLESPSVPLAVGAATAAIGFSASAALAVWSNKSRGFHSVGWYPNDFAEDLDMSASAEAVEADFVLVLQRRLAENKPILDLRGDLQDWASLALLAAPVLAVFSALVAA